MKDYSKYCLLLISAIGLAQNDAIQIVYNDSLGSIEYKNVTKYIQVQVQDSLTLKPSEYELIVSINLFPKDSVEYYDDHFLSTKAYNEIKANLEQQLKKYKARRFEFINDIRNKVPYYIDNYLIYVKPKAMRSAMTELQALDFAKVELSSIRFKDEETVDEKLFKMLLAKAKSKALILAKLSNVRLGEIIEINENSSSFNELWRNSSADEKRRAVIVKFKIHD